jgi:hypothetical protein
MSRLISMPLREGGSVLVEVQEPKGLSHAGIGDQIENAGQTFEELLDVLKPAISSIINKLKDMTEEYSPDETSIEFGIGLKVDTSGMLNIFISAEANADFKVGFVWNK